ncbi:DUF2711 family protein [Pedobacter rhodius]|uniref:DUF2711 family protein n=1 Tax=Pedobacter rhodius TaxID=3004098 RepID=A0ABT4KSM9_9SPHI|nr:DUF2711 family protein [Pedobacter sp. SJ11]MCZ4221929.1 DUF2711 family protein [Pedobacter sp. SJ11]
MNDIFADKNIYPHEGKIKDHYKDFYEAAFVAFLPFFKVDRKNTDNTNLKKSKQITHEEARQEFDILKDIQALNADIFSYSNKDFPTDREIFDSGQAISWDAVVKGSGLKDNSELNKGLRTSIGALRQVFRRPELTEKLNNYTSNQSIWHPTEGGFDILSKVAIYNAFKLLKKNEIIATDEFYETTSTFELDKQTAFDFAEKIGYKDYFIYSLDKELLFTIEWDSFFFLIATGQEKMNKIISAKLFEGFLCNENTEHTWDYEEDEIQKYLDIEKNKRY